MATNVRPFFSILEMISPTRPRATPSGLIRTRVLSDTSGYSLVRAVGRLTVWIGRAVGRCLPALLLSLCGLLLCARRPRQRTGREPPPEFTAEPQDQRPDQPEHHTHDAQRRGDDPARDHQHLSLIHIS